MDATSLGIIGATMMFCIALVGFFITKTKGFGEYTTPLLLGLVALGVATLSAFLGKLDAPTFSTVLYTVGGFAGGLLTDRAVRRA
jgi:NADH:ubiquinone oxidoreductase subunit K